MSDKPIKDSPHYELPATELARWLERQGADRWWSVDGDPVLASRVPVPCPGDELAEEISNLSQTLLLADKDDRPEARGQTVTADDLDRLADHWDDERVFFLSWKGSDVDWMLIEDDETSESEESSSTDSSSLPGTGQKQQQ